MNVDNVLSEYNVFVTGASGFIGTVLLQRLLRVKNGGDSKIYCLLRSGHKFASVSERMRREILTNEIMGLSESEIDDILLRQRVVPVEGELTEELLGLDPKALSTLKHSHRSNGKKGIAIIHCAADIDFNREINESININVHGTFQCISVGLEIEAVAFTHISTLYVNAREHRDKLVMERIYDSGLDPVAEFEEWLELKRKGRRFDAERVRKLKAATLPSDPLSRREWPNSYTLTKSMAEGVVRHYCSSGAMPWAVVRLGIVSPLSRGQHLGWFMGNGGFVLLVIGIATGNIRYLRGDGKGRPDFVPVDHTVDTILAATAKTVWAAAAGTAAPAIYQCGVIENDPSWTVSDCVDFVRPRFVAQSLPYCKENPGVAFIDSAPLFWMIEAVLYEAPLFVLSIAAHFASALSLYFWRRAWWRAQGLSFELDPSPKGDGQSVEHQIRALEDALFGGPSAFVQRTRFMKRARAKMKWFDRNYSFFVNQRWRFDHQNVRALLQSLDAESRRKYNFDVDQIAFNEYACSAALVCFKKYIAYRDDKKESRRQCEAEMADKLQILRERQRAERLQSAAERVRIWNVVRRLFGCPAVGPEAMASVAGVVAVAGVATLCLFVLSCP